MKQSLSATLFTTTLLAFLGPSPSFAKAPTWLANGLKLRENILSVSCVGTGPDKGVAQKVSLDQCFGSAVQYVQGYSVKSKTLSVEDTAQSTWSSEVSSDLQVTGLKCEPANQDCQESEGSWTCYIACHYDLKLAKAEPIKESQSQEVDKATTGDTNLIKNRPDLDSLKSKSSSKKEFVQSEGRHLILTTIPACDDVLIVKGRSRIIKCDEMPKSLVIFPDDREAIVRLKGFKPKHLFFNSERHSNFDQATDSVEVFFEK